MVCVASAGQPHDSSSCTVPFQLSAAVRHAVRPLYRRALTLCVLLLLPLAAVQALTGVLSGVAGTAPASGLPLHFPELELFETHPRHPAVRAAACAWGKALMLSCWMGHLTPWRPEWFANLCHPQHWPQSCPHGGCRVVGCRGNGVRLSPDGTQYVLVVSHHKTSDNSSVRDRAPISYPFPPSLFVWLDVWFKWCWPLVAAQVRRYGCGGTAGRRCVRVREQCTDCCCCCAYAGHHHHVLHLPPGCAPQVQWHHNSVQGEWLAGCGAAQRALAVCALCLLLPAHVPGGVQLLLCWAWQQQCGSSSACVSVQPSCVAGCVRRSAACAALALCALCLQCALPAAV